MILRARHSCVCVLPFVRGRRVGRHPILHNNIQVQIDQSDIDNN